VTRDCSNGAPDMYRKGENAPYRWQDADSRHEVCAIGMRSEVSFKKVEFLPSKGGFTECSARTSSLKRGPVLALSDRHPWGEIR